MKYLFFINPIAGKGKLQNKITDSIKDYFSENGGDYEIYITKYKGDAQKIARERAETGEEIRMFACGGEGTCFEVLNGIVGYDNVSLGVIPCGSANDFLKFFGDSKEFFDIKSQIEGNSFDMDLIKAGDNYCLNGCSVGMDAVVARDMSIFKTWPLVSGPMAYKLAIVKTFLKKVGVNLKISIDNCKPFSVNCLFAVIANAPYYGGGYKGAPNAVPNDGKLDFTLVKTISKLKVPKFLSYYESGTHENLDYCTLKNCSSMEFFADKLIPVNLDGEIIETKNMRFEIIKKAVSFVVPNKCKEKVLINL